VPTIRTYTTALRNYLSQPPFKILYTICGIILLFAAAESSAHTVKNSASIYQDVLVRFSPGTLNTNSLPKYLVVAEGSSEKINVEKISDNWARVKSSNNRSSLRIMKSLNEDPNVDFIQPNYAIHLPEDYRIQDPIRRAAFMRGLGKMDDPTPTDNPPIPEAPIQQTGPDPLFQNQWGMLDLGVRDGWKVTHGDPNMVVAVIDTGVDYTHEDLVANMWRNPGETGLDSQGHRKENNGIDDDGNGFIDDVVGWDFASNDNKPYDLTTPWQQLLKGEGNPGHGTHCAGNIAARGDNAVGIAGVAPNVKIMAVRFITEKGQGTTADAVKAVKYAVDNGAKVLSNSWGSEGEDPNDGAENKALRDVIIYAQDHGILFVAAAGNGHQGAGYDNDSDAKPSYPATYGFENIISVAAIDKNDQLGGFSNWGAKSVHLGAPGVAVFSSMVGNKYSDKVIDIAGFEVDWDGTSMATPHVAGAAALYWSAHPTQTWKEVKSAVISSAKKIHALSGKTVSEGKLDVKELMKH